jgi:hypothetical protein
MKVLTGLLALVLLCFVGAFSSAASAEEIARPLGLRHFVVRSQVEEIDQVTQQKERTAWLEYPPGRYELELEKGIEPVRLLRLSYRGDSEDVVRRLENICERLEYAIDCLDRGQEAYIGVRTTSRGVGIYAYCSPSFLPGSPGYYPIRILTVFPEDARDFGHLDPWPEGTAGAGLSVRTTESLAAFLAAQIEAHSLLFLKNETRYELYERLALDAVVSGRIYREVYISANDVSKLTGRAFSAETVNAALGRIAMYQRRRLQSLSQLVPRDWDARYRGLLFK